jgi:hypothetical protein
MPLDESAIILDSRLTELKLNPLGVAEKRIAELDAAIKRCPIRKAQPGNITMREHLSNLKAQVEADPIKWASGLQSELSADIAMIDGEADDAR